MNQNILSTEKLTKSFGAVKALHNLDITVEKGQIHGIIGPNGSGKTTFVNIATGLLRATEGKVYFHGQDITLNEPYAITKMGISRTFQRGQIFPMLTCVQNVMVGRHCVIKRDILRTFLRFPFLKSRQEEEIERKALELLQFVGLGDYAGRWASEFVWVECQLLQIARALASEPKLLILDEPTAGMGHEESESVAKVIKQVQDTGVTIILISHDVKLVMGVSNWITVLSFGEKICEGIPSRVQNDPKVLEAYFGTEK